MVVLQIYELQEELVFDSKEEAESEAEYQERVHNKITRIYEKGSTDVSINA